MVLLHVIRLISVDGILVGLLSESVVGQNNPPYGPEVAERVTPAFFYGIRNQAANGCAGKNFYTRHSFLEAIKSFPRFGRRALPRREIAAFFAHVTHETGYSRRQFEPNLKYKQISPNFARVKRCPGVHPVRPS
ncbi:Glycoside hydrolase [Macleaya cordata]|uniref:chitinase n=1 Tax=Macleaya cordata TaxID=56857 RepID=A0A200QEB5_MACCD|nr:Glycoside hydrolase [Macleaya cordata]